MSNMYSYNVSDSSLPTTNSDLSNRANRLRTTVTALKLGYDDIANESFDLYKRDIKDLEQRKKSVKPRPKTRGRARTLPMSEKAAREQEEYIQKKLADRKAGIQTKHWGE